MLAQVDAIVFLVDALDRDRFNESRKELNDLLSDEALMQVRPLHRVRGYLQHVLVLRGRGCSDSAVTGSSSMHACLSASLFQLTVRTKKHEAGRCLS